MIYMRYSNTLNSRYILRMIGKRDERPLEMHDGLIKIKFCTGNV